MQLYVSEIPEEGISVSFQGKDGAWEGLKGMRVESLPHGELYVDKRGRDIRVKGRFSASVELSCSRCLEDYPFPMDVPFEYVLRPLENDVTAVKEKELFPEDLEYGYYEGDVVQLDGLVEEYLLLSLPMKPLCTQDCSGICPQCGVNRNKSKCQCPEKPGGSPFDVLKDIVT